MRPRPPNTDSEETMNPYRFFTLMVIACALVVFGVVTSMGAAGLACISMLIMIAVDVPRVTRDLIAIGGEIWQLLGAEPAEGYRLVGLVRVVALVMTVLCCIKTLQQVGG